MIDFVEAQRRVLAMCSPLSREDVPLAEALGRTLVSEALAADDIVPFARSAMDGFAVRSADTLAAPCELRLAARLYAEAGEPAPLEPGTAVAVATGAPIPRDADAVLPLEEVRERDGSIGVLLPTFPGRHVFPPGDDARRGEVLVRSGAPLSAAELGLLASAGFATVALPRRPRVAIICSGDELVPLGATPGYGQIRNSNATAIAAFATSLGAEIVSCVHAPDRRAAIADALRDALACADLTITTGGASVGERDFMKSIAREAGATFAFDSVAMRPARPTAFAAAGSARLAILSGNPAAVFVALIEFVGPALRAMQGVADPRPCRIRARLRDTSVRTKEGRTYLPFVAVRLADEGFEAALLENQCSALTRTAATADGLAVVGPEAGDLHPGDLLPVDVYRWPFGSLRVAAEGVAAHEPGIHRA